MISKVYDSMAEAVSREASVPLVPEKWSCHWQVLVTEHVVAADVALVEPEALSPSLSRSDPTKSLTLSASLEPLGSQVHEKNPMATPYGPFSTPHLHLLFQREE